MKSWVAILIITFLVLPSFISAANPTELEQQIEQVRKEREALVAEQKRLQTELEAVSRETQTLGAAVKSLDATKKKLNADISVTQSKINSTGLTIRSLESTMSEKELQIITHRQAISDTLLTLSEYDSRPLIMNVLAAADLSDIWRDRVDLEDLSTNLNEEISVLRQTKKVLGEEKLAKEKARKEQESLQQQLKGQKVVVEENQKAKNQLLTVTKSKESEYQRLLNENLKAQKQFADDLLRLESELRITLDPTLIPSKNHGILSWPLDKIFVTDHFGQGKTRWHNGVDLRAAMGTPVKAVLGGVISGTGNTDEKNAEFRRRGLPACVSYGGWILIKHNNGLSSVYAHLSNSLVRAGQVVSTGDVIGYSGGAYGVNGSGYSFGPHLHLGLMASQGVEIRQLTNSKGGCQTIHMPIALGADAYLDPLDYLPTL